MNTGRRERSQGIGLLLCLLLSLGAFLSTAHIAQAQERTSGTLTGELKDASGGVLPGVSVVITNKANGRAYSATTDGGGVYHVAREDQIEAVHTVLREIGADAVPELPVVNKTDVADPDILAPGLRAVFVGMREAVREMKALMVNARLAK